MSAAATAPCQNVPPLLRQQTAPHADIALSAGRPTDDDIAVDSSGNYIYAPGKTAVTIGVSDLIVIETDDALLIAAKDRAEEVKGVVDRLVREEKEHLL